MTADSVTVEPLKLDRRGSDHTRYAQGWSKRPRKGEAPHGTRARYQSGCHCDPCRHGNAAYQRAYKHGGRVRDDVSDLIDIIGEILHG